MELVKVSNNIVQPQNEVGETTSDQFMKANTKAVDIDTLSRDCIIPVFSKSNETIISHQDFIETAYKMVEFVFKGEQILKPAIRVSHPVKGRIPEAKHKSADELQEHEKTLFYERLSFVMDIPTIHDTIGESDLSLSVGGVRALNQENLHSRKSPEKFKFFIGHKNLICLNLCVNTDGFQSEIRASNLQELGEAILNLIRNYNAMQEMDKLRQMENYSLSESQFAQLLGKARMFQFLPKKQKKNIQEFPLMDNQVSQITKEYYRNSHFSRDSEGHINLWNLYNLFTDANKSSYIDTFLDRGMGSTQFIQALMKGLNEPGFWYFN